jgi:tripartite-type tricarboxylate transporter receptor subunit TctC
LSYRLTKPAAIILLLAASFGCACAQTYPTRPVRLIVPFAPGGSNDTVARLVAHKLAERWGQQVVVDNRPGAGGNIGSEIVAKAAADGHTLLMGSSQLAVNASLYSNLPFDAVRDLAPVSMVASTIYVLALNPALPARSVKELIALAKSRPGAINYASGGAGSPLHMGAELFKFLAGVDMVHIPYKGGAPAVAAVLSGEAHLLFGSVTTVLPQIKAGRLRALAVTSAARSGLLPELPTVAEAGVPGYEIINWYGVLAPSHTSARTIAKLNADIGAVLRSTEVKERLAANATEPHAGTPEQFASYLKSEISKWAPFIKASGARPE